MFLSKIKTLMKERSLTIRGLVFATGLSSTTLTKARSDEGIAECRLSTLKKIAEALSVTVKDLFEEVEEEVVDPQPLKRLTSSPQRAALYRAMHGQRTDEEKKQTLKSRGKRRMGGSGG